LPPLCDHALDRGSPGAFGGDLSRAVAFVLELVHRKFTHGLGCPRLATPHRVDLAARRTAVVVDVVAVVALLARIDRAVATATAVLDMTGRIAAVTIDEVGVVTLLIAFLDAIAAHGLGAFDLAMVIASVAVGAVAVVALLAVFDRSIAADRLAAAYRIAAITSRPGSGLTDLAGVPELASVDRRGSLRHERREEHAAGDQERHIPRFSKLRTAAPTGPSS